MGNSNRKPPSEQAQLPKLLSHMLELRPSLRNLRKSGNFKLFTKLQSLHNCNLNMSSLPPKLSSLSPLPNELLVKILADLSALEMVRCRAVRLSPAHSNRCLCHSYIYKVCCQFRDLVDLTVSLQYKLELFLAGMISTDVNCSHTAIASAATLQQMRRRRDAWDTFQPTSSKYLQELHHAVPRTNTRFDNQNREHVSRNILAVPRLDRSIVFFQLSSKPMWGLPQCWEITARSFIPTCMAICPEQDLLLLVELVLRAQAGPAFAAVGYTAVRIHILALSTGSSHPHSATPVIFLESPNVGYLSIKRLSFHGNVLGLMVDIATHLPGSPVELWIIDWKSGSTRLVRVLL